MDGRKTAPEPAVGGAGGAGQFRGEEWREFQQRHPAGQRLGHRTHKGGARRPQQQKAAFASRAVDHVAQQGEDLGQSLSLVDDHRAWVGVEKTFEIGVQRGKVGRAFEIEVSPARERVASERALPALAWAHEEHGRKRPEEEPKTIGLLPLDIFHTVHFCMLDSEIQDMEIERRPDATNMHGVRQEKRVCRGGSFLCADQYCLRDMTGTRGEGDVSAGTNHLGFRCVMSSIRQTG
jgi:hypothetical protein